MTTSGSSAQPPIQQLSLQEMKKEFADLFLNPANRECANCKAHSPVWACVKHGVFICIECAAVHRSLGVHISFVRSVVLDRWNTREIAAMKLGGNANFKAFFSRFSMSSIDAVYNSAAAEKYRRELREKVDAALWEQANAAPTTDSGASATDSTAQTDKAGAAPGGPQFDASRRASSTAEAARLEAVEQQIERDAMARLALSSARSAPSSSAAYSLSSSSAVPSASAASAPSNLKSRIEGFGSDPNYRRDDGEVSPTGLCFPSPALLCSGAASAISTIGSALYAGGKSVWNSLWGGPRQTQTRSTVAVSASSHSHSSYAMSEVKQRPSSAAASASSSSVASSSSSFRASGTDGMRERKSRRAQFTVKALDNNDDEDAADSQGLLAASSSNGDRDAQRSIASPVDDQFEHDLAKLDAEMARLVE